jgi:hypothetical protein
MKPFNIGDVVVCVDNNGFNRQLVVGKEYTVQGIRYVQNQWVVDVYDEWGLNDYRHIRFKKDRVGKINRILND